MSSSVWVTFEDFFIKLQKFPLGISRWLCQWFCNIKFSSALKSIQFLISQHVIVTLRVAHVYIPQLLVQTEQCDVKLLLICGSAVWTGSVHSVVPGLHIQLSLLSSLRCANIFNIRRLILIGIADAFHTVSLLPQNESCSIFFSNIQYMRERLLGCTGMTCY